MYNTRMDIIRKGVPKSERQYKVTCESCNTAFRFKLKEAEKLPSSRSSTEEMLVVICPLDGCGEKVYISEQNYIQPIQSSIDMRDASAYYNK